MKTNLLFTLLLLICSIDTKAQFVLTPSDGLKTPDNAYVIKKEASSKENNQAVRDAIIKVIPNAIIEDVEFEKVFTVKADATIKAKSPFEKKSAPPIPFTMKDYVLKIELLNNTIIINFEKLNYLSCSSAVFNRFYPWSGKDFVVLGMVKYFPYIFKDNGDIKYKQLKEGIENWANDLVFQIEQALK